MTAGIHPAITFDKSLAVGQEVEARLANSDRALRFPARIVGLAETTAHVEALEGAGPEYLIPRFSSPAWSRNNGLFPLPRRA